MKKFIILLVLLGLGAFSSYAGQIRVLDNDADRLDITTNGNLNSQFNYSCITSSTSNTEVKFAGSTASHLRSVIISTGTSGQVYLYDASGSTATANLIGQIDGTSQNIFTYLIKLSNGLTIKNENGVNLTITGE